MAIPQDGLGPETVTQLEAYEATAKLLTDQAMAVYIDAAALRKTAEEALDKAFDGAVAALASDHSKLATFVEAVKTEASSQGMSELAAKAETEAARAGSGSSGSTSGSGDGESEHKEDESDQN